MPFTERFKGSFKEIAQNFFLNEFVNIFPKIAFKRKREMYALEHLADSTRTINSKKVFNDEDYAADEELSAYVTGGELTALAKEAEGAVANTAPSRATVKRQALLSKHKQNSRDGCSDSQQQHGNRPGYRVRVAEASDVKAAFTPTWSWGQD